MTTFKKAARIYQGVEPHMVGDGCKVGAAKTFYEVNLFDIQLKAGKKITQHLPNNSPMGSLNEDQ